MYVKLTDDFDRLTQGTQEATEIKLTCKTAALNVVVSVLSKYSTTGRSVQVLQLAKVCSVCAKVIISLNTKK